MGSSWKYLGLITQIGLTIVFSVLLSAVAGVFLDRFFNTVVVFTLIGIFVGAAAGLWTAYRMLIKISLDDLDK